MEQVTKRRRWSLKRAFRRMPAALLLLVLALLVVVCTAGIPNGLARRIIGRMRTGSFAVEARGVRLHPFRGILIDELDVYRRGVVGPPCAEARGVAVGINPLARLRGQMMVRHVDVGDAFLRPRQLLGPPAPHRRTTPLTPATIMVNVDHAACHGADVNDISLLVRTGGFVVNVDNIHASLSKENLGGSMLARAVFDMRTRALRGHLDMEADPHIFVTALGDWRSRTLVEHIGNTQFRAPVRCSMEFERVCTPDQPVYLDGPFWIGECTYRGVDMLRADGQAAMRLSKTNSAVTVTSGLLVRPEGLVRGGFSMYPQRKRVVFDTVSTIDPKALARLVGIMKEDAVAGVSFTGPVRISARGEADLATFENTMITATVQGKDAVVDKLSVDEWQFDMRLEGREATLSEINGRFYGGKFWGDAGLLLAERGAAQRNIRYTLNLACDKGDFTSLASGLLGDSADYRGQFGGHVRAAGFAGKGQGKTVTGQGSFRIRYGRVFMLPVFGGLSDVIARIIPGLEFILKQSDATLHFDLADGKVQASKVSIEGDVLSLSGEGDYHFNKDVDFDVQMTLMKEHTAVAKIVRMLTYPISKLLEFRLKGTFNEPKWYPVNFSKDLLDRLRITSGEDEAGEEGGEQAEQER